MVLGAGSISVLSFQPSEFAKLAVILALASWLEKAEARGLR